MARYNKRTAAGRWRLECGLVIGYIEQLTGDGGSLDAGPKLNLDQSMVGLLMVMSYDCE